MGHESRHEVAMRILFDASNLTLGDYKHPLHDTLLSLIEELDTLGLSDLLYLSLNDPNNLYSGSAYLTNCPESFNLVTNPGSTIIVVDGPTHKNYSNVDTLWEWGGGHKAEYTEEELSQFTGFIALSNYQKSLIVARGISPDKIVVIPNGVDPSVYTYSDTIKVVDKYLYLSPAERGLFRMLDIWPSIIEQRPSSQLVIGSDISTMLSRAYSSYKDGEDSRSVIALLRLPGVVYQPLDSLDYTATLKDGGVLIYPCDPLSPCEFFANEVLYSLYAGTPVVCSTADALGELWEDLAITLPIKTSATHWADIIISLCDGKRLFLEDKLQRFTFQSIAKEWLSKIFNN